MTMANKKLEIHTCYLCLFTGPDHWTLTGYDEFGKLWCCTSCRASMEPPVRPPRSGWLKKAVRIKNPFLPRE